jgi:hypothetical protein
MTSFITDLFRNTLRTTATTMNSAVVRMYLFSSAPIFEDNDSRYTDITTMSGLAAELGWGQWITPLTPTLTMTTRVEPVGVDPAAQWTYVIQPGAFNLPDAFPPSRVQAIAYEYVSGPAAAMVGKLMFVTNTPLVGVGSENVVLTSEDGIIPQEAVGLLGATNNTFLLRWKPGTNSVEVGPVMVLYDVPPFEPARTQHVWMYPQRINFIANPSFELPTVNHWRTNGAKARGNGAGVGDQVAGTHHGHFTGTAPLVAESNTFPTQLHFGDTSGWTIQLQARGAGELKIGLVTWPVEYDATVVDWGPEGERWTLTSTWQTIRTCRRIADVSVGMLRLETMGAFLDLDHVCCEPGWMPANGNDWPYFDGDSRFGALDDFQWYQRAGEATREGKSYSMWYNHRRSVTGRLFAQMIAEEDQGPGAIITDEERAKWGMVYQWVPAGTPITQHLNVLYPGDPQSEVPDVTGQPLPYRTDEDDLMGLVKPWAISMVDRTSHEHTATTVTLTPDPGFVYANNSEHTQTVTPPTLS